MAAYGFDVLEIEPNWRDGVDESIRRSWFRLDPGTGSVWVDDKSGTPASDSVFSWFMADRSAVDVFKTFIAARKGAAVPFWFPTWRRDLQPTADINSSSTVFTVANVGYTRFLFASPARRYLAFIFPDGSKIYRKVVAAAETSAGIETLTLDSALGVLADDSTIIVSYLLLCRLDSDEVKTEFASTSFAEASLQFREIPMEVPA